jgi:putative transcriptional regulator
MENSIRVERAKKNITQEELAKKCNVSRQTISSIEKGEFKPGTVLALKISNFFGTTVNKIFMLNKTD